jgi:hypothetical protein
MKKLMSMILAVAMLLSVACFGVAEEGNWKIAILTGTVSQGEEEFRAAEKAVQVWGADHIITDTYPDNFMSEQETTVSKLVAFEPQGFVNYDLNKGAFGKYIYMAYTRTDKKSEGITDLIVSDPFVHTENPKETMRLQHGSTVVRYDLVSNVNLNKGTGGHPLHLYATKNSAAGEPIRGMWTRNDVIEEYPQGFAITTVKFADEKGYTNTDPDLNKGALGKYIYLIVRRERPAATSLTGTLIGVGSIVAISLLLVSGVTVSAIVFVKRKKNRHIQ